MFLTQTLEIKNHKIHLDLKLPNSFKSKRVKITIVPEEDELIDENLIKNLRGKLNLSDDQYNDIQIFLNEDR
jgi:hypothetical protein